MLKWPRVKFDERERKGAPELLGQPEARDLLSSGSRTSTTDSSSNYNNNDDKTTKITSPTAANYLPASGGGKPQSGIQLSLLEWGPARRVEVQWRHQCKRRRVCLCGNQPPGGSLFGRLKLD